MTSAMNSAKDETRKMFEAWADIPELPAYTPSGATIILLRLEQLLSIEENIKNSQENVKDLKDKIEYYKTVLSDHDKRADRINCQRKDWPSSDIPLIIETLGKKSNKLAVIDTRNTIPTERSEVFESFIKQGGELTLYTAQNPKVIPVASYTNLHILSDDSVKGLLAQDITGLVVGDGNNGCFFWERNGLHKEESSKKRKANWAVMGEYLGNWFRENKITTAQENRRKLLNSPATARGSITSFCCAAGARDLYWNASEAIRPQMPDNKMERLHWGFKK